MSEDIGGFLPLPKNIPKNYFKLSYPVHDDIDKTSILNFFLFHNCKNFQHAILPILYHYHVLDRIV